MATRPAQQARGSIGGLTQAQFRFQRRVGEPGYTLPMITSMISRSGLLWLSDKEETVYRDRLITRKGLLVRFKDLGIKYCPWERQAMVPKSRLQDVLDELNIPASLDDLRRAAMELDYPW